MGDVPGDECGDLGEDLQLRRTVQRGGPQDGEYVFQESQRVGARKATGSQGRRSMWARCSRATAFRSARQSPLGGSVTASSPLTWSTISSSSVSLSGA